MVLGAIMACGCRQTDWRTDWLAPGAPAAGEARSIPESDPAGEPEGTELPRRTPVEVLQVSFDILQVRAPAGTFSASAKIWNHLDEEAVPAGVSTLLQRNGFRVGRGSDNAWHPIRAILGSDDGIRTSRSRMTMSNGYPLLVELASRPGGRNLFLIRRDGTTGGVTLPAGRNVLRIEYAVPPEAPDALRLNVCPEVQLLTPPPETVVTDEGLRRVSPEPPARTLRELAFQVQIGPSEFLAVGPGAAAGRLELLPGSFFLQEELDGTRYESIYFVTPRVLRRSASRDEAAP